MNCSLSLRRFFGAAHSTGYRRVRVCKEAIVPRDMSEIKGDVSTAPTSVKARVLGLGKGETLE